MPTYEYVCGACGHAFERFQKMSDDPVRACPECGRDEAERKISPGAGIVFKGSGFYATDYRDPPPKKDGGETDGSGGAGEKGSGDGSTGGDGASEGAAGSGG